MSATTKQITRAIKAIVDKNSSLPIIESVYFTGNTIVATDLEVQVSIPFKVPEPFIANAVQVNDVFDSFGINFIPHVDEARKIHFRSGNRTIKITETDPIEDFPGSPVMDGANELGSLSEQDVENILIASDFVWNHEFRPAMCCVAIINGQIVSTDSHRLFWADTDSGINGVLVKRKTWKILNEFVGPWIVDQTPTHERFVNSDNIVIIQTRETERYPNYKAVIPKENPIQLTATKKELTEALKQGKKFANKSTQLVAFCIDGGVTLRFQDLDMDREYSTELKLVSVSNCEAFNIGFNIPYLEGVLKHCPETVIFQMSEPQRAALVGSNLLLMPVQLKDFEF